MRIASSLKRSKQYTNKRQDIEMITKTTKESKCSIIMKSARNSANDDIVCVRECVKVFRVFLLFTNNTAICLHINC